MVDFNPNAPGLQSQIQAQLEANRSRNRVAAQNAGDVTARVQPSAEERTKARGDEESANKRLPALRSSRGSSLSTHQEIEAAGERVSELASNLREAPAGRTSTRQNELRNQPLGQIIDILV
ncbi:hypothetical protein [Kordiimonas pumila]|uniref:Uncharacterized protein n=1 Tax=Kordiimonas pumila TaxID=2161677 RepID=A0ABV7D2X8_9PROT|nr:hypothetical protein [Kordiimonas pumila]